MTSERRETNEVNPKTALVFCLEQQQKEGNPNRVNSLTEFRSQSSEFMESEMSRICRAYDYKARN